MSHVDCETGSTVTQVYDSVVVHLPLITPPQEIIFRIIKGETTNSSSRTRPTPQIAHPQDEMHQDGTRITISSRPRSLCSRRLAALEHATGVKATVVGKPTQKKNFETVINKFSEKEVPEFGTGRIAVI